MKLTLTYREPQAQIIAAALQHFLVTKTEEIATNQRIKRNEYDLLDPKHCVMHALALLHDLTSQPMAYFMNPLQTPTGIAPLQEGTPTSHPSPLENVTGGESPIIPPIPTPCESAPVLTTDETKITPRCAH